MLNVSVLGAHEAANYKQLAFPRHRDLLLQLGLDEGTVAVGANVLGEPWGLALAQSSGEVGLLCSVAVIERARRRGLATRLLTELEATLRERGVKRMFATYRTDRPQSEAVGRLLERRGFDQPPERAMVELRYQVARVLESPALDVPCSGAAVVPFSPEGLEPLLQLHEESGLSPANVPPHTNDPALATLITFQGEVAACVLGYRAGEDTGHIVMLYVRREHRRGGLGAFATRCFLLRLAELGLANVSCEVRLNNEAWLPFADGKLAPVVESRATVQHARKDLLKNELPR